MTASLSAAPLALLVATFALAGPASAQQFQLAGELPGGAIWTEAVEAADVDLDGDLDLFTANGEGIFLPALKLRPGLFINQLESAPGKFAEEGLARLGPQANHGKNVRTADVDADGWVDALVVSAFGTDAPFLYINRGAAQPGFFDEEGGLRGLTVPARAAGASFGDVDNDGDLDLVIGDTGPQFSGPPGGRPRLLLNDGSGSFTPAPAAITAPVKLGHLDVDFVDIDQDWDLDILGTNRGSSTDIHHLLLNDGSGLFTDASELLPATSTGVYESDLADLDNDTDLDVFFLSLSGFADGAVRNNLLESGSLDFTAGPALGDDDDNEVVFIDYDMDGDLDVVIGSLGPTEKLVRNDGLSLTQLTSVIANVSDRTLDVAAFDLDNDRDYDLVTVQGESDPGTWQNRIYRNDGPIDDVAPRITRVEPLVGADASGPWVVRAEVRDEVHDDGYTWVEASVTYRVDVGLLPRPTQTGTVQRSSGAQYRFEMTDTAGGLGTRLSYVLSFTDWAGNTTTLDEVVVPLVPCGFAPYGSGTDAHTLTLSGVGSGALGTGVELVTTGAPAAGAFTFLTFFATEQPILGGILLVDLDTTVLSTFLPSPGGTASWTLPVPELPLLLGVPVRFQSFAPDASLPEGTAFSNGLELVICD